MKYTLRNLIKRLFVPQIALLGTASLVLSFAQVSRHVRSIYSAVEATTGFLQNQLLCPTEVLNMVRPIKCPRMTVPVAWKIWPISLLL